MLLISLEPIKGIVLAEAALGAQFMEPLFGAESRCGAQGSEETMENVVQAETLKYGRILFVLFNRVRL